MDELDEQYISWLCEQAKKWKEENYSFWIDAIKEHCVHLRKINQVPADMTQTLDSSR